MIKLKTIGPNQTELNFDDGLVVFFSYETPVAAFISGRGYIRSEEKYSKTTTKHVNQWLDKQGIISPQNVSYHHRTGDVTQVPQYQIDALISAVN